MTVKPKPYTLAEALSVASDTRSLQIGPGAIKSAPDLFRAHFGEAPAIIVADPNTFAASGQAVADAFRSSGHAMVEPFLFQAPELHAEQRFVEELETALRRNAAVPIAVGSGTINDLGKYASHLVERPYMCVATAASMDGYTSYGAAITRQGAKQTLYCPAPRVVVADIDIICAAPGEMNAWGYADLLAKVPAGADWILADALGAEPIHEQGWDIVQGRLRELLDDPAGVRSRKPDAIRKLIEALMMGGFAMQVARTTRAASGAEHLFSHTWEMQHHTHNGQSPSHGFKVAIGTIASAALYERLLQKPLENLDVKACCAAWPDLATLTERAGKVFAGEPEIIEVTTRELAAKHCDAAQLGEQLRRLKRIWPELRERLRRQLLPVSTLRRMLRDVGAPTEPEEIGITRERLRQTYWQASFIRRRFMVLDLAFRAGLLESCLDEIFGPEGLWPIDRIQ